jgi:hypothetical protein
LEELASAAHRLSEARRVVYSMPPPRRPGRRAVSSAGLRPQHQIAREAGGRARVWGPRWVGNSPSKVNGNLSEKGSVSTNCRMGTSGARRSKRRGSYRGAPRGVRVVPGPHRVVVGNGTHGERATNTLDDMARSGLRVWATAHQQRNTGPVSPHLGKSALSDDSSLPRTSQQRKGTNPSRLLGIIETLEQAFAGVSATSASGKEDEP